MPLRRVDVRQAGADALGILVPPGTRTIVILRPRTLAWDLLPVRWDGATTSAPVFCTFGRDEAALIARRLGQYLETCDGGGVQALETFGRAGIYQLWLRGEDLFWIVCARSTGASYQPMTFVDVAAAEIVAARLSALLFPGPERQQQYYFNTQNFAP